jgi:hypothetical protein
VHAPQPETGAEPGTEVDTATGEIVVGEVVSPAEVVVYPTTPPKVVGGLPYVRDLVKLARTICATEMVPAPMRGRFEAVTACFMRGHEMGLGPMQSLDSFDVIQGRVALKAEAMRALTLDAGHQLVLEDVTDDAGQTVAVSANCRRRDWPPDMWRAYTYSLQDAAVAGLLGKDSWKKSPRSMLDARATSGACRRFFPDVLAGMSYTPEEVRDFDDVPDVQEPPPVAVSPSLPAPNGVEAGAPAEAPGRARKAQGSKKTARSTKPAAMATPAPSIRKPATPDGEELPDTSQRTRELPSGEVRITDPMRRAIMAGFSQLDVSYTRSQRLRYMANLLELDELASTWDLSVTQASQVLDHLQDLNGVATAPPEDAGVGR